MIFIGDDWAEDHHDVHGMETDGHRLAARRLPEGLTGIRALHELVATTAPDIDPHQVVIGIETDRGSWVTALAAGNRRLPNQTCCRLQLCKTGSSHIATNPRSTCRQGGICGG